MGLSDRFKPLTTLPFLICLTLLMFNDFYLKGVFHNALTGKLSDFCGLFIFPIFWSVFLPKRRIHVFFLTGLFFIFWKSEYSSSFIEFFSRYCFPIQRVVDPTDLIALIMLPLAWYSLKVRTLHLNLNPSFIVVLAFFAFCASSSPGYHQAFEQPQYVLIKSHVLPDSNYYDGDFAVYHFDSLLVVEVKQLITRRRPVKKDDYHKNIIVNELEETVRNEMQGTEGLMAPGKITYLSIKTPHYEDALRFKGGLLDGKFIRKKGNLTLIEGVYKNGVEDSIWTFRDGSSALITKKTFVKGETTQIQKFEAGRLVFSDPIATRADTITRKYVQLVVLMLLVILMVVLIVKNYRRTYPEILPVKTVWKWVLCFTLPIAVWLSHLGISLFITDHFSGPLVVIINFFMIYISTSPLLVVAIFMIKWRRKIDVLWYCLLFALVYTFIVECIMLVALSSTV